MNSTGAGVEQGSSLLADDRRTQLLEKATALLTEAAQLPIGGRSDDELIAGVRRSEQVGRLADALRVADAA